jgi:hypothetical protein
VTAHETKTFTLRFPVKLHQAAADAALREQMSLNQLVQQAIEEYIDRRAEEELFDSFTRLGEDLQECNVDFAWDAQREAIDRASI